MSPEAFVYWHNRNRYACVAGLSLFIVVMASGQILIWKNSNLFVIICGVVEFVGASYMAICSARRAANAETALFDLLSQRGRNVESRFDQLERLRRREMITPVEYEAKRQEILKDL